MARLRIGVFDSGVGGLTVVRQLLRLGAEIVYLADTARVPYGNRAPQTVRRYAFECVSYLVRQGVDLLVVACNTVSAVALDAVREVAGELPVAEVVTPAVAAAVEQTQTGHIGVIGTRATIESGVYERLLKEWGARQVSSRACPLFVPLVEEGWYEHPVTELVAREYLQPLHGVDTLILGCTHYPLLLPVLARVLPGTRFVDSGVALVHWLQRHGWVAADGAWASTLELLLTDAPTPALEQMLQALHLGSVAVQQVRIAEHVLPVGA